MQVSELSESCEVIPRTFSQTFGPPVFSFYVVPVTIWYLSFVASSGPPKYQSYASTIAGQWTCDEIELAERGRLSDFEDTRERRAALRKLVQELEAKGWRRCGTGDHWYSMRFRRDITSRPSPRTAPPP